MKCPRCGKEMTLDNHRKIDLFMCYECGYIEGRKNDGDDATAPSNFERLRNMNFNEAVAFLSSGLDIEETVLAEWFEKVE